MANGVIVSKMHLLNATLTLSVIYNLWVISYCLSLLFLFITLNSTIFPFNI